MILHWTFIIKCFSYAQTSFKFLEHIFIIFSSVCGHAFPSIYNYYYSPQDKNIAIITGDKLGMFLRYLSPKCLWPHLFPVSLGFPVLFLLRNVKFPENTCDTRSLKPQDFGHMPLFIFNLYLKAHFHMSSQLLHTWNFFTQINDSFTVTESNQKAKICSY